MTDIKDELKKEWCKVLGIETCEGSDNFFDLGGNSLQVVKILNFLDTKYGVEIDMDDIFENLTLSELTSAAEQALVG